MRTRFSVGLFGLVCVLLSSSPALAQGTAWNRNLWNRPTSKSGPAISPYLNLLRSGSSFANNYYNLVRPQQEFRGGINTLQSEVQGFTTAVNKLGNQDNVIQETGHGVGFMTHGSNFQTQGARGASSGVGSAGFRSSQVPSSRPKSSRGGSSK